MSRRPITVAEMEAARTPKGGWNAKQLRLWGVRWPPESGWRKRILKQGVPADCPYPVGFVASEVNFTPTLNPATAFGPAPVAVVIPVGSIEMFTDGSCDPNPGPGGWGFAVFDGAEEIHESSGGEIATTNNRMELCAVIEALRWLSADRPAIVWSDSQYVVRGCMEWRHGWKRKSWTRGPKSALANADLWQDLDALLDARIVDVRWTRGHVGTAGNERADELADIGRESVLEAASPLRGIEEQLRFRA